MANEIVTFQGYKRLTYRYNDGWKHEEEYEYVGEFRILSVSEKDYGDENSPWYGESWDRKYLIKAPRGVDFDSIQEALRDAFRYSCCCEHDCCGHTRSYVQEIQHKKRREYLVTVNYAINC